ncbi:hypothetical protein [Streptomyces sp. NBC_00443]|uniref:hypothetical protein n=1 Tax=Streptomyces sp. NBC_00443 TaxID=2975743 RepID=UPI002E1F160E
MPRVDVEGSLMCDVLADGTVVGQALVEAVYDTSSGTRIGTRPVDPVTGADYLVQGTLQPCPAPEQCSCETVLLCAFAPVEQPTSDATVTVTASTPGVGAPGSVMGAPFNAPLTDSQAVWDGSSAVLAAGPDDRHTYIVGAVDLAPDCGGLDPAGSTVLNLGVRIHNDGTGAGCGLWGRFTVWANGVDVVGAPASGLGVLSSGTGIAPGATVNPTRTATVSNADLLAGNVYVELNVQVGADSTFDGTGCTPNDSGVGQAYTVDQFTITAEPVAVTGCLVPDGEPTPFLRHICRTCTGIATVTDTTLDGVTEYDTAGAVVAVCGPTSQTASGRQVIERCGCDQTASGIVRYVELWSVDTSVPDDEPLLLGTWLDGDFTQPYEPVSPVDCPAAGPEEVAAPIVLGHICYDDGTGTVRTAAVVRCAGCDDTTVRYVDVETGAEVAAPAVVPCPGAAGDPAQVCYTAPSTPPVTCGTVTVTDLTSGAITAAAAVANPQGWPISAGGLASTWDGDTSAAGGPTTGFGVINCNDFEGDTGVVIDYTITPPASNVTGVNLWNAFGAAIGDRDGIGSATLTLLDADGNTLFTGPLNACSPTAGDYATPCLTDLGGPVDGVATMRLSNLAKVPQAETPNPDIGWREIGLVTTGYEALLTLDCGGQEVTATVEGAAAGLTYAGGQLTQTGGPHTLTWHVPAGFAGTIVTDTPGAFDRLDFTDGTVVTVSGDGTVSFAVQVGPAATGDGTQVGFVTLDPVTGLPTVRDANTGQVVPGAVIVPCPGNADCASPTTPVTSVGLCLADGTPIAVTITRDCTGATVSEGWLNLSTGAWSAGAVPAGTVACGDSRSIQVSGTFCAVDDATEDVVALVLVEYTYDDTGAISAVRLVDATTGATYVPPAGVTVTVCPTGTAQPEQDAVILCHTAADGTTVTQFARDYRRDETGTITGHSDYLLDGTPYTPDPTGTVGVCQPGSCTDCETLVLCDVPTAAPVRITGTAASGTLSNGVSWTSTSPSNATYAPQRNNADGSWWGMPSFPLATTTPTKWTFSRPSFVEFSVYIAYNSTAPALNHAQLPAGLEPVSLPTGYAYDPASGVLTRTSDGNPPDPCSYTTDPQVIGSARFRTTSAVTTFTTAPAPNSRIARCGIFFTYWAGAVSVVPGGPFLRHICRSCDGTPTVTNTLLDGVTPYLPAGTVDQCHPGQAQPDPAPEQDAVLLCHTATDGTVTEIVRDYQRDETGAIVGHADYTLDGATFDTSSGTVGQCRPVDCTSTPLCVRPSGVVEFISNAENRTTGAVDSVWKWSSMSLAGPWYDMYQVGIFPGWTVTDAGTPGGTAHWVALHPNSTVTSTGLDGEGPTLTSANPEWYARASFELPSFADPATIQVASTVLNADQLAVEWRLNAGPWQAVGRNHQPPAYTFGPAAVPGAQAGTNTIYVHGRETVFGSGAAGVMMHLIVTYDVDPSAYEQWLRTTCSDGSISYLDGDGNPQTGIPADYTIVPCPGGTGGDGFDVETWPLCILDSTGTVVQQVRAEQVYDTAGVATGAPRLVDAVTGDPATVPAGGSVTVCPGGGGDSCIHCETVILADSAPLELEFTSTAVDATPYTGGAPNAAVDLATSQQAWDRIDTDFNPVAPAANGQRVFAAARIGFDGCPPCGADGQVNVQVCADWHNNGPTDAPGGTARFKVFNGTTEIHSQAYPNPIVTGGAAVFCTLATVSLQDVIDGKITATVDLETVDAAGAQRSWEVRQLRTIVTSQITGCGQQFARTTCRDCEGNVVSVTQTTLTDGETYEPVGDVSEPLPPNPCVGGGTTASGRQLVERCGCSDEDGDGIAETRYVELWSVDPEGVGTPLLVGTYVDGDFDQPLTPAAPMDCPDDDGATAAPVLTGLVRVTDTNPRNLSADFPGLQSVTLTVIAGNVAVAASSFGATIPAGTSLTWSALDGEAGPLGGWSATGQAGADYLLAWTYTA